MSSGAGFPVNDLLRRKLQTSLTVATLTLSVASTLFLLLFSGRVGVGIASAKGVLTFGLSAVFGQFLLFVGVLIFVVGAILTSFIVFLMMAQRTRDFGLIKAAGCPNALVGGYFMTELITVALLGCFLGVIFGFLADFAASIVVFGGYTLPNWWFAPIVFVGFFVLAVVFGLRPMLKAAKMTPIQALSSINYYGSIFTGEHKALSHSALTWRLASRSLSRRLSGTVRIVFLLSTVFVLLTVSVSGVVIASDTTSSWVQKTLDSGSIAVAHSSMGNQYEMLLSAFSGGKVSVDFNYSDPNLRVPETLIEQIEALSGVSSVDSRLVTYQHLREIGNFTIPEGSMQVLPVGDSREGDAIVVGVEPQKIAGWAMKGRSISGNDTLEGIIGDSVSQTMYYPHPSRYVVLSDPLVESFEFRNTTFHIVGICVDPLNNGLVAYVPLDKLLNATGLSGPNVLLIKLDDSINRTSAIQEIENMVKSVDSDLDVFDLSYIVADNRAFLGSTWQTIMLLPLFSLISAALCLVGYMLLSVEEQRQEFGMLRAVGAKPKIIVKISAIQSIIVLLSSFGFGISLGVIITIMILMANPLITPATIAVISAWLVSALFGMLILSFYPAFKLAKTPILKIMA
jgi:ABC-type antimicrobial peptide transport system permease subunit